MRRSVLLIGVLAVLTSGVASAAKVGIVPFTGPRASIPRGQVVEAVCATQTCVPQAKLTRRGRPDWKKVKREGVDVVLMAAVKGSKAKRVLWLDAMDSRGRRMWREKLPLARNGKLTRSSVQKVAAHFAGAAEQPAEVAKREEPVSTPREEEKPKPAEEPAPPSKPMTFSTPPPMPGGGEAETKPERPFRSSKGPLIVAAAGVDFVHRSFVYTDLRAPNLRSYETRPVLFAPRLHLEVYPLRKILTGIPSGLGVEADYSFAMFLRSVDENDVAHSTSVTKLDVAARLNLVPSERLALTVAPIVGYRSAKFEVGAAPDGTKLAGMPGIDYGALTAGAEVEYAGLGPISLFARGTFLYLLGLGEIGSDAFFPEHGGNAFEAQGGVGYEVLRNLEIRALLHYTRYGLSFTPAEGATYNASGAVDQYAGGALMARFTY